MTTYADPGAGAAGKVDIFPMTSVGVLITGLSKIRQLQQVGGDLLTLDLGGKPVRERLVDFPNQHPDGVARVGS